MPSPVSLSVEQIPLAALVFDSAGIVIEMNAKLVELLGFNYATLLGQHINVCLAESSRQVFAKMQQALIPDNKESIQLRFITQQQHHVTLSANFSSIGDDSLLCLCPYEEASTRDNHVSLLESAHSVLQCINEPYWEWSVGKGEMHYSAQLMSLLGYEKKAITAPVNLWKKHVSNDQLGLVIPKLKQHLTGEYPNVDTNFVLTTKQHEHLWVHLLGKVLEHRDGKPYRMYGSVSNITESKSLLKQLHKQNEYLNLAEKVSHSGHWRYDVIRHSLYCSDEIYRIFGVDRQKFHFSFKKILSFYDENDREEIATNMADAIQNAHSFYCKKQITQPIGKKLKVETIANVELDSKGNVTSFFGVCRDVSKTESAFEKLKLLAMVNHTIKVPIFFIDDRDNIVYQDISSQENGKNILLFNYVNFSISEYLALKSEAKRVGQIKQNNVSFDNFTSVFDLSVTFEKEEGIYIWIVENVTEKFRKEQQQIISNRLALLGNTFGSVSHDINNVLGVALGSIEMLELKFKQGSQDISSYIERVKNAIDKGKGVTERLLAFTRKPTLKVVDFNPNKDIEDNRYLLKQVLVTSIALDIELDYGQCVITFPQAEFINILLNLVLNAQDAIQEAGLSGKIVITTKIKQNKYIEVHVKDSGIGIKAENISKIFDPFYSSKSVNKGNGIGLANVYSTMYKHNGQVLVEGTSDLGGAHFTLLFPCHPINEHLQVTKKTTSELNMVNKRVLILDDEISIAEFVAMYLESEGARCVHVDSKASLLSTLKEDIDFDVFITDMIMPDLTGQEAVDIVKAKHRQIQIYSMSGYISQEDSTWEYPVLRKPFNAKELAEFLKFNH